jgi:hypothetical protein
MYKTGERGKEQEDKKQVKRESGQDTWLMISSKSRAMN